MPDTPTASQLWDSTSNYRREGGPGTPNNFKLDHHYAAVGGFHLDRPCWMDSQYRDFDVAHAAAILGWHGLNFLIGEGFHRFEWDHCSDTDTITLTCYSIEGKGATQLDAINAVIGAVLDARKGKNNDK